MNSTLDYVHDVDQMQDDEDEMHDLAMRYFEEQAREMQKNDLNDLNDRMNAMRQELLAEVMSDLSRTERRALQGRNKRGVANRRGKKQGGKKSASTSSDSSSSSNPSAVTSFALNAVLQGGV